MIKKLWNYIIIKNGHISLKKLKIVYKRSFKKKLKYYNMIIRLKRNKYKLKSLYIKLIYNKSHNKSNRLDKEIHNYKNNINKSHKLIEI